ncbi:hypothetical protein GIB67_017914 [Kingdonia uniflora]|uniref:Uncharacterized protein n=1 Tax=Kingdonia uniflora TaxID=39325 RepID=A0A7J7NEN3_9MAGN|nr:hypothetical protein GIB67_017914 [Kingdonia uniflora]
MDDDADKEQPLDKGNAIHLETLKYEQVRRWLLSSYNGIEEWEKKYDMYLRGYMRVSRRRGSTNVGKPLDYILWLREQDEYVLPEAEKRKIMRSANNLWRNGKKTLRKKYHEWDTDEARKKNYPKKTRPENWVRFVDLTSAEEFKASRERNKINKSKMMEVDPTITRLDSFLVGHTRSDGTFPTALVAKKVIAVKEIIANNPQSKYLDVDHDPLTQVFGKVKKGCVNFMGLDVAKKFIQSTEILWAQIIEGNESYIDLENRFSQYKAENDAKLDSLRDMVTSLRSFERAATPTVNVDRSRMFSPILREVTIAHFLDLHENIVASGRALVIPSYQESEEAEYEVIVDIIFEQGSPVFGQRGVFFDELLIGTKIKYPRILLRFSY